MDMGPIRILYAFHEYGVCIIISPTRDFSTVYSFQNADRNDSVYLPTGPVYYMRI